MKVLIVGGVAGGATTAARLRRLDENAEIVIFEKSGYISYANCGLPYYLGGVIAQRERLVVTRPETFKNNFNIDVRVHNEVVAIDRDQKRVEVLNLQDGSKYHETYDKLVLSPGAYPRRLNIEGENTEGVFFLRNVENTIEIDEYIIREDPARAIVVGAGFVGVEMAENLHERGLSVSMVEFAPQALGFLDRDMVIPIHEKITEEGINLHTGVGVNAIHRDDSDAPMDVELSNGELMEAELVIIAAGVVPDSRLAQDAGLSTSVGGSILVNDQFETDDPDIYAVGDAICVRQMQCDEDTLIPLAGPANRQGRQLATLLAGHNTEKERTARDVQGSSIIKVFDLTAAATGINERIAQKLNIDYLKTYIFPADHATYYPGSTPIALKMLFTKEGQILGAQAVGHNGIDKRMDVISTAMRLGASVYDLQNLELCYAPPYSSAKDPVNMLGFTAVNILKGDVNPFYPEDIPSLLEKKSYFLDVREDIETELDMIDGAIKIPVKYVRERMNEIPKDRPIYVYCQVGLRGYNMSRVLSQNGFEVYNLAGGYRLYEMMKKDGMLESNDQKTTKMTNMATPDKKPDTATSSSDQVGEITLRVDACGLSCPGPIMKAASSIKELHPGQSVEITATDPAFGTDISAWSKRTGNILESLEKDKGQIKVVIRKGTDKTERTETRVSKESIPNDKTIVFFSGDLDKAIAAFIIANGAASMGRKVTMFFTFWGLNVLRRPKSKKIKKAFIDKMFGRMMPKGSKKLRLSKMNMMGAGSKMIRGVMKKKNIESLEALMTSAQAAGVRLLACQMSMDVMGIKEEELIDGVELAGVAAYLSDAETADTNLFI